MASPTIFPYLAARLLHRRSPFSAALARWRRMARAMHDPYRPERHYMRGPGPRWHQKHGGGIGEGGA